MNDRNARLVTAEAVRRGHPDKFCDQIADAILDAHLSYDPNARVAVEVMATAGNIAIAGEVTSRAEVDYGKIVDGVIRQVGYRRADLCEEDSEAAYQRAKEITGLDNPGSVAQLKAWLADQDVPMESLAKKLVQEKAANTEGVVSELLSLRLELSQDFYQEV